MLSGFYSNNGKSIDLDGDPEGLLELVASFKKKKGRIF